MKCCLTLCSFMLMISSLHAQGVLDETAIRDNIGQQESAWNRHDWEAFSSNYTEDGTLINFVGQFWKGRSDILAHFKLLSACCLEPTSVKFEVKNIRFLAPALAIVYTEETLFADRDYTVPFRQYKKGDIDYKWKIEVFVKVDTSWKVASTQMTLINQQIAPHNGRAGISSGK